MRILYFVVQLRFSFIHLCEIYSAKIHAPFLQNLFLQFYILSSQTCDQIIRVISSSQIMLFMLILFISTLVALSLLVINFGDFKYTTCFIDYITIEDICDRFLQFLVIYLSFYMYIVQISQIKLLPSLQELFVVSLLFTICYFTRIY